VYADRGALMPLDDYLRRAGITRADYIPAYWDLCSHQGRMWGLPSTPASLALHWNKKLFREAGLDPDKPLWVPAWLGSAFNIFLLRQFFLTIPRDLTDAAIVDGCSEFGAFRHIILPLSKPALAVVALFHFLYTWNDFLGPLIYLTDQRMFTLSLGLQFYQSQHGGTEWNLLMAAATMVVLPIIVLFFFTQRTFIQGIAITGLKG